MLSQQWLSHGGWYVEHSSSFSHMLPTIHHVACLPASLGLPGYYGPGGIALNITNSLCTACSAGSSSAPGSTQDSDCNGECSLKLQAWRDCQHLVSH